MKYLLFPFRRWEDQGTERQYKVSSWEGVEWRFRARNYVIPVPHFQPPWNTESQVGGKYIVMKESVGLLPNYFCKHTVKEPGLSSSQPHLGQDRGTLTRLESGTLPGAWSGTPFLTKVIAHPKIPQGKWPLLVEVNCQQEHYMAQNTVNSQKYMARKVSIQTQSDPPFCKW